MNAANCKLSCLLVAIGSTAFLLCSCQTAAPQKVATEEPDAVPEIGVETPEKKEPEPVVDPKPVVLKLEPQKTVVVKRGVHEQADQLGATATRQEDGVWRIEKGDRRLELKEKSRRALLNDVVVYLSEPFVEIDGTYEVSEADFEYTLRPALEPPEIVLKSKIVVIDPGHGGAEPGTENQTLGILEKDLNLDVAVRLQALLEENGYKVVLTRYNDRLVPLEDRSKIANRSNAGLFVSIHFNAAHNEEASGIETYVLTPPDSVSSNDGRVEDDAPVYAGNDFDPLNFELGYQIQSRLIADLQRQDRGIKRARFKVLTELECPGILVECGFLSHGKEARLVNTPVYRQKLAESLSHSLTSILMSSRVIPSS